MSTLVPLLPVSHLHKFKWLLNILYNRHAHKDGTSDFLWTSEGIFMTGLSHGEKKKTGWDRRWKGRNEGEIERSRLDGVKDGGKDRNSKSDKERQRGKEKKPL